MRSAITPARYVRVRVVFILRAPPRTQSAYSTFNSFGASIRTVQFARIGGGAVRPVRSPLTRFSPNHRDDAVGQKTKRSDGSPARPRRSRQRRVDPRLDAAPVRGRGRARLPVAPAELA